MGELIFIDIAQKRRNETLDQLWSAYTAARAQAEKTQEICDGIAAGRAWAAWLDAFRAVTK